MTRTELRQIAAASGIQHAEFCLEQHTTQIGRAAADPLWQEMAQIVIDYADEHDGLGDLPDIA